MDLSIIIPARNEMFLSRTVEDILSNIKGDTEVIVVLDGEVYQPEPKEQPKLKILRYTESIGQRAATNAAVKLSEAQYIMKTDGHCAFAEGFDVQMIKDMQPNLTMAPIMRNLHAFDWVCGQCGNRTYQGITPISCPKCDNKTNFERDIVWIAKTNPQSTSYCFDSEPHFQYFSEVKGREDYKKQLEKDGLTETMSLQGSCFMLTREKYWEQNICDETFGSWGSQGIEVACKTWLSGGRVVVNHNTWYAHMFRTKGGDFGFPYAISGRQTQRAKYLAKEVFFGNKWALQKRPLSWLIEKFWPVPGWTQEQLDDLKKGDRAIQISIPSTPIPQSSTATTNKLPTKGIVYYTDNRIDAALATQVQETLICSGLPIVSVSLKPIDFVRNIVLNLERSYLTMFKQILAGIESLSTDVIFLAEHDVLYTNEHFAFTPDRKDIFYYNKNNWQVRQSDGYAVFWDCKKVSQVCGYRDLMLKHYRERVRRVELEGFTRKMGFEPGTHGRAERVDDTKSVFFETEIPNLDIRHAKNLTQSRWNPTQFRNPCRNWKESHVNRLKGWEQFDIMNENKGTLSGKETDHVTRGAPQPLDPETGMHKDYWVLSEEERAKGFIKPVRTSYKHVGIKPKHTVRILTEEEQEKHKGQNYLLFEMYPESEAPLNGRFWTEKQLSGGCGTITIIHKSIAETYARNPKFYGYTFCSHCREHFPVEEFDWDDGTKVGE